MSTDPGPTWPEGYDRVILDEVDSTNSEAIRIAGELKRPTWILAHRQTAARGRQGRTWANPDGNFAATLMMRPEGTAMEAAQRSFLAANALFETLAMFTDRTRLANKWPNDVLLNGGKVAGILLESAGSSQGIDWLAIGIGVNLMRPPTAVQDASFPPVALFDEGGASASPEEFLDILAGHYATQESILSEMGFTMIREHWLRQAARLGEVMTAHTGRDTITGTFETVDEAGSLVLITSKGRQVIPAADVHF